MRKVKILNINLARFNLMWVFIFTIPIFITLFLAYRFSPRYQMAVLVAAAGMYLMIALFHHFREKTLTLEIIIEYVLIAALALIILQGLVI